MSSLRSIYKSLLLLYPGQYRKEYGAQIMQTIDDMLASEPQVSRKIGIWAKEVGILPAQALGQHRAAFFQGNEMAPNVLAGFVALVLLAPFFMGRALDEMSEHLANQHLYGSWFWSGSMLMVWVVVLPAISLLVSVGTWVSVVAEALVKRRRVSLQIKKLWFVTIVAFVSGGVLFGVTHGFCQ